MHRLYRLTILGMALVPFAASGFSPCTHCSSDDHVGLYTDPSHMPQPIPYGYDETGIEDEANELEDDTSWAGQREDFSDMLFR